MVIFLGMHRKEASRTSQSSLLLKQGSKLLNIFCSWGPGVQPSWLLKGLEALNGAWAYKWAWNVLNECDPKLRLAVSSHRQTSDLAASLEAGERPRIFWLLMQHWLEEQLEQIFVCKCQCRLGSKGSGNPPHFVWLCPDTQGSRSHFCCLCSQSVREDQCGSQENHQK